MNHPAPPDDSKARLRNLFTAALAQPTPEERQRYLDVACGTDADLRKLLDSLLEAHEQAAGFMERSVLGDETDSADAGVGTVVGPYRLIEKLGEGGFGIVYLAEQEEPVRRQVALKIIKPGMDSRQVIARFEAERQALALMDHPHIAHVYEAGASAGGRPYFAMELVRGVPLTEYCDSQRLSTARRLELFLEVCGAVQHAHQKGVVHRDLKPSNVVVAVQDQRAVPKVIDFGIAKSVRSPIAGRTQLTQHDLQIGTPAYMSPEQVGLGQDDVDTRSDIYSLGVLLYELLTGSLPFEPETLREAAIEEARRILREEEPKKPSTRLAALGPRATEAARRRAVELGSLKRILRGDLDWIVMKALAKEPDRRYATADGLALDLQRHLDHEPVSAGPPSRVYRARKFVRRHRQAVLAAGVAAAALVAGLLLVTFGFLRAEREREQALALVGLFGEMLGAENAQPARGHDRTVREMVDEFAGAMADRLQGRPDLSGEIHRIFGRVYNGLNDPDSAYLHHRRAVEALREAYGPRHLKVADSLADFSWFMTGREGNGPAVEAATEAMEVYLDHGVRDARLVHTLIARANFQLGLGRVAEAEADAREALRIAESAEEPAATSGAAYWLAKVVRVHGQPEEAERLLRRVIDTERGMDPRLRERTTSQLRFALRQLGAMLVREGRYAEAEVLFGQSLPMFLAASGPASQQTFDTLTWLRGTLQAQGKTDPAVDRIVHEAALQQAEGTERPSVSYRLRVGTPGEYRLYLRWDGSDRRSDSVWARVVELQDGVGGTIPDVYGFAVGLRGAPADGDFATDPCWQGEAYFEEIGGWHGDQWSEWRPEMGGWPGDGPAVWTIVAPGDYTLRLVMREPGAAIDAFTFQLSDYAPPEDVGAEESSRTPQGVFLEAEGRVAVEAEHFSERTSGRTTVWQRFPDGVGDSFEFKNARGEGYLRTVAR